VPLIVAVLLGHYVFKFHPAILFGVCAGVRRPLRHSNDPGNGEEQDSRTRLRPSIRRRNTLLTLFGMVVVLLMSARGLTRPTTKPIRRQRWMW